jgi:hypothetical protein
VSLQLPPTLAFAQEIINYLRRTPIMAALPHIYVCSKRKIALLTSLPCANPHQQLPFILFS